MKKMCLLFILFLSTILLSSCDEANDPNKLPELRKILYDNCLQDDENSIKSTWNDLVKQGVIKSSNVSTHQEICYDLAIQVPENMVKGF